MAKFVRAEVLDDLQRSLWRYLSPSAIVSESTSDFVHSPGNAISEKDFQDVLLVHLALSPLTTPMLSAASLVLSR